MLGTCRGLRIDCREILQVIQVLHTFYNLFLAEYISYTYREFPQDYPFLGLVIALHNNILDMGSSFLHNGDNIGDRFCLFVYLLLLGD